MVPGNPTLVLDGTDLVVGGLQGSCGDWIIVVDQDSRSMGGQGFCKPLEHPALPRHDQDERCTHPLPGTYPRGLGLTEIATASSPFELLCDILQIINAPSVENTRSKRYSYVLTIS